MSNQITTAFVQEYKNNVEHLLQQQGSRLESCVMMQTAVGRSVALVEQVGAITARKRTSRHADTPLIETPHAKRWAAPEDYEAADLIDNQDLVRMLTDPKNPYAVAHAHAMGRAKDDEIIAAFNGTALTGANGTAGVPLPASQTIVAAFGPATSMTVEKLQQAKKLLMAAEVDVENDELFCALSADQHDDLLSETETRTIDTNDTRVLVNGMIHKFMGFTFKHSERLLKTGTERLIPVWAKSGMCSVTWNGIQTDIGIRRDKSNATQVYTALTCGASRLQEQKVVMIECTE